MHPFRWRGGDASSSTISQAFAGTGMFSPIVAAGDTVTIFLDGNAIDARIGETVAACLMRAGTTHFRTTPVSGAPRLPYCMIGHCFDCLLEIDGRGNSQACLATVRAGMRLRTQQGAAEVALDQSP